MTVTVPSDVPTRSPSVVIIEDHVLLADMLVVDLERAGIRATAPIVVGSTVEELVQWARDAQADVALVDLWLGELGRSFALIEALTAEGVDVLVVTGSDDRADLAIALAAGAVGVVSKHAGFDHLREQIDRVLHGLPAAPSAQLRQELAQQLHAERLRASETEARFSRLTRREAAVLGALMEGFDAAAIADLSHVSITTVRTQIASVLRKLGVGSQLAAVAMAHRAGWRTTEPL